MAIIENWHTTFSLSASLMISGPITSWEAFNFALQPMLWTIHRKVVAQLWRSIFVGVISTLHFS
jgi:hypothetical protein